MLLQQLLQILPCHKLQLDHFSIFRMQTQCHQLKTPLNIVILLTKVQCISYHQQHLQIHPQHTLIIQHFMEVYLTLIKLIQHLHQLNLQVTMDNKGALFMLLEHLV